ncbi:MAG: HD domain-containing protein [Candidatus Methanomarinus sp.]|uniref:HD domain-containing protein n=1 Tax=Candidatus Methanomarinus sp. TaxID=3386244 RepID=A0AC61SCM2_9EURY|nr:MAG: HD domain-containing protein [ANME-2 cluster archaeon]
MKIYEIRDSIYGFITFNDWEKEIINHPAFQRLRRIQQLSLTSMVYPGAIHTRFEHSLGVMQFATLLYDAIVNNDENEKILKDKLSYNEVGLKKDKQLIRLAALLHDVGHAPFSHATEEIMPINDQTGKPYRHEDYTTAIIKGPLKEAIENHQINKTNYNITAEEVAALIEGNVEILRDRIFWKVIISSQLDADKGDYLLRDSYCIGIKYGIYDHSRLINTIALGIDPESDEVVLGVDQDGWHVAESIVIARYQIFTQVYFHKTRRAYDYHIKEAMKTVLDNGKLPTPKDIDAFIRLDDYTAFALFRENDTDYNCKSILNRNHIRVVYHTPETPSELDEIENDGKKKKLEDNGIWFYEDTAEKPWYKLNGDDEEDKEIMIINGKDRKARPLSELSSLVSNMKGIRQLRIYVKFEDKEKAKEVLNGG